MRPSFLKLSHGICFLTIFFLGLEASGREHNFLHSEEALPAACAMSPDSSLDKPMEANPTPCRA